jgi:hypothetical protein
LGSLERVAVALNRRMGQRKASRESHKGEGTNPNDWVRLEMTIRCEAGHVKMHVA